jgi:small subunit ribosomal protein S5
MVSVSLKDSTIPHEILCRHGGAKVILRPASPGTGLIAGKTVRAVLESVGIKDVLSKSLGSNNPSNVVKATIAGLLQLRLREDIYRGRGLEVKPRSAPVAVKAPVATTPPPPPPPAPASIPPVPDNAPLPPPPPVGEAGSPAATA